MDWIEGMQRAIDYIEEHLTDELPPQEVARQAHVSSYHFQRVFAVLTNMSVGEYVRARRLTQAGQELSLSHEKVLDVSLKYGYESPESFCKAFARFHGVTPAAARRPGALLRSMAPLRFTISLEGGKNMDYRIEKKDDIYLTAKVCHVPQDRGFELCPKCFDEYFAQGLQQQVAPAIALCAYTEQDRRDDTFTYAIGDESPEGAPVPNGFETIVIPTSTWAVFPCRGALPKSIQNQRCRVFTEWLPTSGYTIVDGYDMEVYSLGDTSSPDYECEIWMQVERKPDNA